MVTKCFIRADLSEAHQQEVIQAVIVAPELLLLAQCEARRFRNINADAAERASLAQKLQQLPLEVHVVPPCAMTL